MESRIWEISGNRPDIKIEGEPLTPIKHDSFDDIVDRFYSDDLKAEVSLR